jgi:predicted AAA+ superfamily ATPase
MELRYLRDTDKREIDFVVLKDAKPLFAVECKSGEKAIGSALRYFSERTPIPRYYQTHLGARHYESGKVTVLPFVKLCEELGLP